MPSVPPAISTLSSLSSNSSRGNKQLWLNLCTAGILVLCVICAFYKTVFSGQQISRVYQLGQRDTLFLKYFDPKREGYDASVYQYFVPSHSFTSKQLKNGIVPLWNPLVGCGAPYLADVETAVFWPARLLLMWLPDLRSWNLLLVMNIITFALGLFLLGKTLELRRFAIVYGSLICAFCPFLIFQSELIGSSASMIPLVMASFVNAHAKNTLIRKVIAGIACAVMILSGHPEPSFFGIVCSSMLYLFLALFDPPQKSKVGSAPEATQSESKSFFKGSAKRFVLSLMNIAIIGVVAFSFSAFMLLPFLELLKNSDCYKLGLEGHRFGVPLNSILINLIHPAYNNSSPFLGILSVPLALFAVLTGFKSSGKVKALSLCTIVSIALMSQLGPLDMLMNSSAFSWFVPKYCWPSLLIFIAMLAASGFESLIDAAKSEWRKTSISIIIISLLVLLCLGFIRVSPEILQCIRQDEAFEKMQVFGKFWTKDLICLTVFALLVAVSKFFGKMQSIVCVLAVSVCTVLSMAPIAKIASPVTAGFNYDLVEPIPFLQEHPGRVLTMGRHVFCPSSNFVYGINNLVPVNVYHPRRFQDFLVGCGITPEGVNQFFDGRLTSLVDLAAVKYIVSPQPVLSKSETAPPAEPLKNGKTVSWGLHEQLRLSGGSLAFYQQNRELLGSLSFKLAPEQASELAVQPLLLDEKNNVLWLGDTERLMYLFKKKPVGESIELTKDLLVPLPAVSGKLTLGVQIFSFKDMAYLHLNNSSTDDKQKLTIAQCQQSNGELESPFLNISIASEAERRFKLCQETASHVRVYENTRACPQAYLCHNSSVLASDKEVLNSLISDARSDTVLLEKGDAEPLRANADTDTSINKAELRKDDQVGFKRVDCNHIEISLRTKSPSFLVLTENFYPGWHAEIEQNGSRSNAKILHANYLFQAVAVPAGDSVLRFSFSPAGFSTGLVLFGLAIFGLIGFSLRSFLSQRKGHSRRNQS